MQNANLGSGCTDSWFKIVNMNIIIGKFSGHKAIGMA